MTRPVAEWIGKDDAERAPPRVRDRIRNNHPNCHLCGQPFARGERSEIDHVVALINGGGNREGNLRPAHIKCHKAKTAADVAEKAKVAATRKHHRVVVEAARPLQGQPFAISPRTAKNKARAAERQMPPRRPLFTLDLAMGVCDGD